MKHVYEMELLSPAGNTEALRAAVDCGANAVYLGYQSFGARASAVNFDGEALQKATDYAHLYGVRVYVTVNTLIKPSETEAVMKALEVIDSCHADSVIIQDFAVALMVRKYFPRLHMHASTQMAICNAEQARFAASQGFSRVVLARECSLEDVKSVTATGMETEVFAHGALCTAVSGRCLMSSMAGGRSGNRGRCAQPCRQRYEFDHAESPWLSLRDLCVLEELPLLQNAGVTSIKLEGRLKSPEYVAVVTGIYRKALDEIKQGCFSYKHTDDLKALKQIFNRGGFTRGHIFGAEDADLVSGRNVSHEGLIIGHVETVDQRFAEIRLTDDLHNEDSLQLRGKQTFETRYSGPEVKRGAVAKLRLREDMRIEKGVTVARLADSRQLEQARAHHPKEIPISMAFLCKAQQPIQLTVNDGISAVTLCGEIAQTANKHPATAEDFIKQLIKTGDTPFSVKPDDIDIDTDHQCFLPVSVLNQLRRDALARLERKRIELYYEQGRPMRSNPLPFSRKRIALPQNGLAVLFRDSAQAYALRKSGASLLIYDAPVFTEDYLKAHVPDGVWLRIPPQLSERDTLWLLSLLKEWETKLEGLWVESIGWLHLSTSLPIIAGEGVPVCNPMTAEWIKSENVSGFSLWPEWNKQELSSIPGFGLPAFLKVYGRESLMYLNHCPKRVALDLNKGRSECAICHSEQEVCGTIDASLTDQRGYRFPLIRTRFSEGCEINVLNYLPTDLSAYLPFSDMAWVYPLIRLTTESPEEALLLTRTFSDIQKGIAQPAIPPALPHSTAGHWLRGVD